jgi:lipid-A-disaccharide synthase
MAEFFGLGGSEMGAAGMDLVVRAEDVTVMGITEVIRHMPHIYGEYRRLVAAIKARRPDVAVLIDFPDVNLRLARELKKLGVPVIYFVSPQLWAWKRRRLRWVQERVDRMMVIFPFEESFYRARGVAAEFVGHPLAELSLPTSSREEYAEKYGLDPAKHWIALLPGSRWKEIRPNLGALLEMRDRFPFDSEYILPVASTIDSKELADFVVSQDPLSAASGKSINMSIRLVPNAREALYHARASVVASGTATVQAAVIGNPFVVVYRVSDMTYRVAKRLVQYPAEIPAEVDRDGNLPVGMVNLIAGRRIVPELLQDRFTAENVATQLKPLLEDGPERERMIVDLVEVRARLCPEGSSGAIQRVCDAVESLLPGGNAGSAIPAPGSV